MKKLISTLFICFLSLSFFAQKEKDSISTEVINVVTSYKPTISDAFKSNDNPVIKTNIKQKSNIEYSIKSSPVKSVFTPNIGGYKPAKTIKKETGYTNYLKAGYGNYGTPLLEGFLYKQKEEHEAQFFLYNKASNGGIDGVVLDDNYLNTRMELQYKNTKEKQSWQTTIGYHRDRYNWYGIPFSYNQDLIDVLDEEQLYNTFFMKGKLNIHEGKLKTVAAEFHNFSDAFSSSETIIKLEPTFEFPIQENKIVTTFHLDILNGKFNHAYNSLNAINYGFLTLGTSAYYPIQKDNIYFSIGAKLLYNADIENNKNSVFIYPDIHIDYVLIDELFNIYGGFTGGLNQNSFNTITAINPYVSPTLEITPTSNAFNIFTGIKGKLTPSITYNAKVSYSKENNKLLFRTNKNLTDGSTPLTHGYEAGNSFYTLYDDVNIFGLFGEIKATLLKDLETGASLSINSFQMSTEVEAWNLPPFKATIFGNYRYEKWSGKAEVFAVGKRKDISIDVNDIETNVFLEGYLDVNLSANYAFTKNWQAFIELNNVLNKNYETYANYQVQGFQFLIGAIYKFDFK